MEDFLSQDTPSLILSLIYSFFLTWFIGLLPVILIRGVLIRRPLSKSVSVILVSFFGVVNFVLFTLLGSKSYAHGALLLVGLVSYCIYASAIACIKF